jgi:membrane-associated phospholipid phosphatase
MRSDGRVEAIQSALPEPALALLAVLTTLGDLPVLVGVSCLAYLVLDRRRGAYTFATVLGGFALLFGLKATLAFSRPDPALHLIETASTGFPSGHALGTTVVYGALAAAIGRNEPRRRTVAVALAGCVVLVTSLSRVALGVHYPIDVIAGVLLGVGYLLVVARVTRGKPSSALRLAAALAVVGLLAGALVGRSPYAEYVFGIALDRDATTALGATVGALVSRRTIDRRSPDVRIVAVALVLVLSLSTAGLVAGSPIVLRGVVAAIGTAGIVLVADRWHRSERNFWRP